MSVCIIRVFNLHNPVCFLVASGALVISAYAVCPDITVTVTPDLEDPDGKGISNIHSSISV